MFILRYYYISWKWLRMECLETKLVNIHYEIELFSSVLSVIVSYKRKLIFILMIKYYLIYK